MPDSISVFSPSHINDLLTMLWMFLAMTWAYRSRVKPLLCAGLVAACLVGGMGSILLQEKLFPNFGVYMLLFVLWGCIYGAAALKGSFLWKSAMAAVYGCVTFQLGKVAALVNSWLPEHIRQIPNLGFLLFQLFAGLTALFLAFHAVTTERKAPPVCWMSLTGVALIGVGFAYYQMNNDPGADFLGLSALYSIGVVVIVLTVQQLCARVILEHERNLVRLSLESDRAGEADMARQASRTEEELRRYRHETVNHLNALSALLSAGKTEEAKALVGEMTAAPLPPSSDFHSGNPLVDAIFSQKRSQCEELGIEFSADLVLTEALPLTDAELSSLLGNLLNNAIEAARQCEAPFVRTRVYPARDYLCIEVVNRADEKKLRGNPSMVTTKDHPELHGIGLRVVKEIAQRHQGLTSFAISGADQFAAQVMIHL